MYEKDPKKYKQKGAYEMIKFIIGLWLAAMLRANGGK